MTVPDVAIKSLIADVRRMLWLGQLQHAVRAALWAWAVIMIAGAILHALIGQPGAATTLAFGAAAWLAALAATALRRPTTGAAALHADRRLGGQSAFATWLETGARESLQLATPAQQRLLEWTAATAPTIRDAMNRRRTSWRLVRPAVAAVICTALAVAVMMLGGTQSAPVSGRDASLVSHPAATESPQLDQTALADAIAAELAAVRTGADAVSARDAQDHSPSRGGAASAAQEAPEAAMPVPAGSKPLESNVVAAASGSGREAGDTRDDSAPGASSRAAEGPLLIQRRDVSGSTDAIQRLADDERVASYEDERARGGGSASSIDGGAAAARPPAARHEARLSPAEVAYVADWQSGSRAAIQEKR